MRRLPALMACIACCALPIEHTSAQSQAAGMASETPITIERANPETTVPLTYRMRKLFVSASVNGKKREFFFDTGSPTILTRTFVHELGLEPIAQNIGVDANGRHVTMDVVRIRDLTLGGVRFHNVPALVFDYSTLDLGDCFFDGGVIGSEILPGSVWRVDTEKRRLTISAPATAETADDTASSFSVALYDLGYPHGPIVDYSVGEFSDKALFDTGSAEPITLFGKLVEKRVVKRAIAKGSMMEGRGSEGVSAGGQGAVGDLARFTLSDFRIGGRRVGPVHATTRSVPPTLLGLGLLDRYVVTFDYPAGRLRLEQRDEPEVRRPAPGYGLMFVDGRATVTQLFEGSRGEKAGLRLGDHVTAVDGKSLVAADRDTQCRLAEWLANTFDGNSAKTITVEREGDENTLKLAEG